MENSCPHPILALGCVLLWSEGGGAWDPPIAQLVSCQLLHSSSSSGRSRKLCVALQRRAGVPREGARHQGESSAILPWLFNPRGEAALQVRLCVHHRTNEPVGGIKTKGDFLACSQLQGSLVICSQAQQSLWQRFQQLCLPGCWLGATLGPGSVHVKSKFLVPSV